MEKILSLDLGKFNSVACILTKSNLKAEFLTVKTTGQAKHDLFAELSPDIVLFEVGASAGWISDMLRTLDIPFEVANTNDEAWKWKRNKKKTDKRDAHKLAMMYIYGNLPAVHMPSKSVRQKRALSKYRQSVVKRITQSKNIIRALLQTVDLKMHTGKNAWTQKGLDYLRSLSRTFEEVDDVEQLWRSQLYTELQILEDMTSKLKQITKKLDAFGASDNKVKLLQTIPGIGPRVAEAVRDWRFKLTFSICPRQKFFEVLSELNAHTA